VNFSKISANDRLALGTGAVIVVTALLSISNEWGLLMVLSLAAGLGAIALVLQPQLAPERTIPMTKGMALLGLGGITAVATGLTALDWLGWIVDHMQRFDTIQFLAGLAAAFVLLFAGFVAFQAEREVVTPPAV
jgi:hypothetical protein